MNPILEALQYPFMQQALAVALLLAVTCALLSCYIVHKGWALMGDAISHAVLPGIVIASSLGAPLILGAFAAGRVPGVPMRLAGLDPVVDGGLETPRTARGRGFLTRRGGSGRVRPRCRPLLKLGGFLG